MRNIKMKLVFLVFMIIVALELGLCDNESISNQTNQNTFESNREETDQVHDETLHRHTLSTVLKDSENSCPLMKDNMDSLTQEQFLSVFVQECRYDKFVGPNGEGPLNVSVQMDIKHIDASEHQQFRMNMLLHLRYTDDRLKYNHISPNRRIIVGNELVKSKIWTPHILLVHERQSAVIGIEGKDAIITINPYGQVTASYRMDAVIYCWMNLKKFPFDKQKCSLSFRTWADTASSILLIWDDERPVQIWDNNHPVQSASDYHLTQFSLVKYFTLSQIVEEPFSEIVGNYSMVTFEFVLSRQIGFYMLDYFIPSCLLVAATWGTFWLQADNAPARTTLGTSPMLAFITLAQGQNRALPKVSYIKASDIWFLMCAVFIFASTAEFFFVNVIWRRKKHVEVKKVTSKYILKSTLTPRLAKKELEMINFSNRCGTKENLALDTTYLTVSDTPDNMSSKFSQSSQAEDDLDAELTIPIPINDYGQKQPEATKTWTSMTPQEVAIWLDRRCRFAFPCAFLVCNIIYWSFVLSF